MPDRHDMRVVREDLVRDWIDVLVLRISGELQLDQISLFQRCTICWIRLMFQKPPYNVLMVEYHPSSRAYRRRKWL